MNNERSSWRKVAGAAQMRRNDEQERTVTEEEPESGRGPGGTGNPGHNPYRKLMAR
jgi:hypothetical protein